MADEVARTILKYEVDKQSLSQTQSATRRLKGEIAAVGADIRSKFSAPSAELSKRLKDARHDIANFNGELRKTQVELEKVAASEKKVGGLGSVGGKSAKVAGLVGGLAGGAAAEPIRLIGDFAETLTEVGPLAAASAVGIGAVSLALGEYNKGLEAQRNALQGALGGVNAFYQLLASGATSEDIQKQISDLEKQQGVLQQQRAEIQTQIDSAWNQAVAQFGDAGARALKAAGQLPTGDLEAEINRLGGELLKIDVSLNRFKTGLEDGTFATNDAEAAEKALTDARTKGVLGAATKAFEAEQKHQNNLTFITEDQVDKRLQAIGREVAANDAAIKTLLASGETTAEVTAALDSYRQKNAELRAEYLDLELVIRDTAKEVEELNKQAEYEKKQREEIAALTKAYNTDIAKLETDALEKRADLAKSYNDKLVDLAQEAADSASKALQNLLSQREELAAQLARDEATAEQQAQKDSLDAAIAFQREEERAARDHARNLKSIRDRAADSELKQIADRDFQSLFFSRRQTARELNEASQTFIDERQERALAAKQAADDRAAQYAFEREQRFAQYQQNLQDADKAYRAELNQINANLARQRQAANTAYQQSLTDLNIALSSQLRLRRDGYVAELQLASKTAQERVKIEQQVQDALLRQAQNTLSALSRATTGTTGGGGGGSRRRAVGGALLAGQSSLVNEGRAIESFAAGGQRASFPNGLGVFTALKSGNVNPRGGNVGGNLYVSISGSNPDGIWRVLEPRLNNWLAGMFGVSK